MFVLVFTDTTKWHGVTRSKNGWVDLNEYFNYKIIYAASNFCPSLSAADQVFFLSSSKWMMGYCN